MIRTLAANLRSQGKVWVGRGRKPKDDPRPTLIQELCRTTGLDRSVVHRALAGKPRASRRARHLPPPSDPGTQRSQGLAQVMAQSVRNQSTPSRLGAVHRTELNVGKNVAHRGLTGPSVPQTEQTDGKKMAIQSISSQSLRTDRRPQAPPAAVPPSVQVPGARGLEHIGLRLNPLTSAPDPARPPPTKAARPVQTPHQLAAIRALEDGIDFMLAEGDPPPDLKTAIKHLQMVLAAWRRGTPSA